MTTIKRSDAAYLSLRQAIVEHALVPGTKLPEDALATHFKVSRTLIRAALARLASEGLIDIGNKRTATVARPSREEAKAVFEVRRCLEEEVVRLVIERWQPSYGATLEGHVRQEEEAAKSANSKLSSRLASEFHLQLAQMSGNPLLERYVSEVVSRCSLILAVYGREHSQECGIHEHFELIAALRARDVPLAQRLMTTHMHAVAERALAPEPEAAAHDILDILDQYSRAFSSPEPQPIALERKTRPTPKKRAGTG
ncbi:DNA-binding GntR family transcriptional regulator [Paraburkholderia sp. GAS199]|uniref:GntR family transcriptional regulator n=1 Tax=Paraburkholderia sp. GAS199 TaxID=3035126 RepID=UPI003D1AFAE4